MFTVHNDQVYMKSFIKFALNDLLPQISVSDMFNVPITNFLGSAAGYPSIANQENLIGLKLNVTFAYNSLAQGPVVQ